jgi:hypothetical protein
MICNAGSNHAGTLLKINKTKTAIGISLIKGANAAGIVRRHPIFIVKSGMSEMDQAEQPPQNHMLFQ